MSTVRLERTATVRAIEQFGVIGVIRLKVAGRLQSVVDALAAGGVRALEVTMTVPGAVDLIRQLAPTLPEGFLLGAGTVLDGDTARAVIDAGASFVVSPVLRPDVIQVCHKRRVVAVPGCFSPTEILAAYEQGADIVKVFPSTSLGPAFIKDVLGPLPHLKLMPTGGVTIENAGAWISAGAVAVGLGSALVSAADVEHDRFEAITDSVRGVVAAVAGARRKRS